MRAAVGDGGEKARADKGGLGVVEVQGRPQIDGKETKKQIGKHF